MPYTLDDAELERLRARDPGAQARFFRAQRARVEGLCARVLGHGPDALEIAADVLGDFLFRYVDGIASPRAVSTYLKLMATRRSIRWSKRRARTDEVQEDGPEPAALEPNAGVTEPAVEQAIWTRQMIPRLDLCLDHLTPKAREVLKLRFSTDLTNQSIGDIVGGSKQYIGRLIKESTVKLRNCLES